jgi:hypothetical protein
MTTRSRHLRTAALAALALLGVGCKATDPIDRGQSSEFVLELRWLGTAPTGATLASFEAAATTIRSSIVGPLNGVSIPNSFNNVSQCDASLTGFPDISRDPIPGLVIYIRVQPIDGVNGTLGSAGPCLVRGAAQNNLPALGVMRLDEADVANLQTAGRLQTVVLHEMLHVLGFGTIWTDNAVIDTSNTADARFLGSRARTACAEVHSGGANCSTTVPVHSADGVGSKFSHWRESLFTNELMTPFLTAGSTPMSAMTIQSLADLGYVVSTTPAQPFTVSGSFLRAALMADESAIVMAEPTRPRYQVTDRGELVPYRPR